ncbi:Glycosylphosphatidylinositol anchor attachment 1 protein [Sesamum alatum]|uniref:Glycosylphosphatidylinositol anchor attachment 1 protein n=1 Tax=Sesamum alatum TaxID=300844 RepID=A0AAE2CL24_9LAMI|nr:Glycosylphosphatidylinositol anchor attachment 1 protein [Sesamum alatum]
MATGSGQPAQPKSWQIPVFYQKATAKTATDLATTSYFESRTQRLKSSAVVEYRARGSEKLDADRRATMAETEPVVKPKPRPIIRIGLFLISHSLFVSVVCCTAGILALLLLPALAKNTYISENALMPGSASPRLSHIDASEGQNFVNRILNLDSEAIKTGIEIPELIAKHMVELGGEVNYHKFQPISTKFHPLHFFLGPDAGVIQENYSCSSYGINTVGIIRAPRGDGKEAIVMVTPYNSVKITTGQAFSLGVAYSVFSLLARVTWLAKDIIWLAADSKHGEYAAVAEWLRDYNALSFGDLKLYPEICGVNTSPVCTTSQVKEGAISDGFRRAGTMAAALVIKVADSSTEFEKDVLNIYAEASNGQMPNLDLINIVNYFAVGQGLRVRVEKIWSLLDSWLLNSLGELIELLGKVATSLNPQGGFGIPVADYVEGSATLASSLYNQALGVPTGPHGAFRDYQVDAITMEISPKFYATESFLFLLYVGRLVEGVIRSVNNLLEKFHQSFFLYLLTSPSRFVSVGVYMIAFALLIAPLPLVAAALCSDASKTKLGKDKVPETAPHRESVPTFTSWKWLYAAKTVLVVHLWSAVVTLLPYFLYQIPNSSPSTNLLIWITLSVLSLFFAYELSGSFSFFSTSPPQRSEWALLKSVTVAVAFIGLCLMSVINFATAEIGALLLVPMCLTAVPLRHNLKVNTTRALVRGACHMLLVFVGFPPTAFLLLKGASDGFGNVICSFILQLKEANGYLVQVFVALPLSLIESMFA